MKLITEGRGAAVFAAVRRSPYRAINTRVQGPARVIPERRETDLEGVVDDFLVRNTFFLSRAGLAFRRDFFKTEE